ncbi:zinc finger protein 813-like [Saccostrea cucullata]|uniref:zinc finger protein 813-like n=1 Tax=Saccostrea cuccullata TaxID=36930 RepID=UPI002ED41A3E
MEHPCPHCNKKFSSEFARKRHLDIHLNKVKLKCNFCGKEINRKDNFERHLKTCEKSKTCSHCAKCFKTSIQRRIHILKEHRDKLLKCERCKKEYLCEKAHQQHIARCKKYQDIPGPSYKSDEIQHENNQDIPAASYRSDEKQHEIFINKNMLFK